MVLRRFADYAAGVRDEAVPPEAVHAAKRCVIDWFASVIPGAVPPTFFTKNSFSRSFLFP